MYPLFTIQLFKNLDVDIILYLKTIYVKITAMVIYPPEAKWINSTIYPNTIKYYSNVNSNAMHESTYFCKYNNTIIITYRYFNRDRNKISILSNNIIKSHRYQTIIDHIDDIDEYGYYNIEGNGMFIYYFNQ